MSEGASVDELRAAIEAERAGLAESIATLREALDARRRQTVRLWLPALAGAVVLGFVLAGGIRAASRLAAARAPRGKRRHERGGLRSLVRS